MSAVAEPGSIGSNRLPVPVTEIAAAHAACRRSTLSAITHAIECGRSLIEAKGLMDHGAWEVWLRAHVPEISVRTAQRYMTSARRAGKSDTMSYLRLRDLTRPAQERLGYIGDQRVLILTPSTRPGFTYVTIVSTEAGVAEGFLRPVRDDAIKGLVDAFWKCMWPPTWDRRRTREHQVNPWLVGARPAADTDQRGPIDDIIARADRKLDGLGHTGPRCAFPEEGGR